MKIIFDLDRQLYQIYI